MKTCARLSPARVAHELVERRVAVAGVEAVEQPPALPDGAAHGDLAQHDLEDPLAVDLDPRVLLDNRGSDRAD